MAVMTIGHVSGGHINPAVTFGMIAGGKIKIVRGILYIVVQCAGAAAGTGSYRVLSANPDAVVGHTNLIAIKPLQGLGIEFFLGFLLVLCVFGVCDSNKPDSRFIAPLAIGLTVTLGHLGAVRMTGSSMNPARTFGTAVVYNEWENHWLYWIGPILGGIAAALLYTQALKAQENLIPISEKYRTNADEKEMRRLDTKGGDYP
jgi:aquaporin related protein